MKDSKVVNSLKEAVILSGLMDGMRISFHHHFRNGDYVFNMVFEVIADLGIKDLTVNMSGTFDVQQIVKYTRMGIITGFESTGIYNKEMAALVSEGKLFNKPIVIDSHGGRASSIETGKTPIDVAFLGAPSADCMGNLSGKYGPSACGPLSAGTADALYANKVIAITDSLVPYPLNDRSISEINVDYVVVADKIGDASGIVSGITKITRDPVNLRIAKYTADIILASGLLETEKDFGYQTGGGSISLAGSYYLMEAMLEKKYQGAFILGGITGGQVEMLKKGCFRSIQNTQCFDLEAVRSLREDANHNEVSMIEYASPTAKSCGVDKLSAAILGATEVDVDFNCNALTDSSGYLMAAIGGHSDVAAGAKLCMVTAPLTRARMPIIRDKLTTLVTPGRDIDVIVTQAGIAVNPRHTELKDRLISAGLPVREIHELKKIAETLTGKPKELHHGDKVVCEVMYRGQHCIDRVFNVINRTL